ncbi:MAG TPA: biotin/lipoyl-binding protein [Gemmatimonadales bacterium]|jgi:hypothetical protein|nr:biotin/lipoyl-binding protein [Gemmatimonadales bacterium]
MSALASTPPPPPGPDLSRLRIDRDAPPPALRRALARNLGLAAGALIVLAGVFSVVRRGGAVPVQVVTATATTAGGRGAACATSVTANGYVIARTRAAVSAKLPGRLADLRVSEGSFVRRGEVIARLENTDYRAQVQAASAAQSTARATLMETEADRDELARQARPPRSILASFVAESALIAAAGGVIGGLMALPINGIVTSTTNWASFSEIAFAFRVSPLLLLAGLIFAVAMGVVGGFFPAWRAARLPVVQAMR